MKPTVFALLAAALLLGTASAAWAQASVFAPDDLTILTADCGKLSLPEDAIDSCLARVQALDATQPSPQLQGLAAQLQQKADRSWNPNSVDQPASTTANPAAPGNVVVGQASQGSPYGAKDDLPPDTQAVQNDNAPMAESDVDNLGPVDQMPPDANLNSDDLGPPDTDSSADDQPPPPEPEPSADDDAGPPG